MIPLKLFLYNFMCYKDNVPPVNFEGIEIACLCGENGHGKSALLDAITWAIWGKSRAKLDDDLVYLGQTDMQVALEFSVQDSRYRVIRKYSKGGGKRKQSSSSLDLAILPESSSDWHPLTGNTMSDTEHKIKGIIRLDYDTFINSAYLRQGQADEFTSKAPAKRKEVLSNILGLSLYEEMETKAKEHIKTLREVLYRLEGASIEVGAQLTKKPSFEIISADLKKEIDQKTEILIAKQTELEDLNNSNSIFEVKSFQLAERVKAISQIQKEFSRAEAEIAARTKSINEYEDLLSQSSDVISGYQKFKDTNLRKDKLDVQMVRYHGLNERKVILERNIESERSRIDSTIKVLDDRLQKAAVKVSQFDTVLAGIANIQNEISAFALQEKSLGEQKSKVESLTQQVADTRAANVQLRKEMEELKQKMEQLSKGEGSCPLCGTPLAEDRCAGILQSYQQEGEKRKVTYIANSGSMAGVQLEIDNLKKSVADEDAVLRKNQSAVQRKAALLEREIEEILTARQEIEKFQKEVDNSRAVLSSADFAKPPRDELEAVKKEIVLLAYDQHRHEFLRQELAHLRDYETRYQKLAKVEAALPLERASLQASMQNLDRWHKTLSDEEMLRDNLSSELIKFSDLKTKINIVRENFRVLKDVLDSKSKELAGVDGELTRLKDLQAQAIVREREKQQLSEEVSVYLEIAESAGKQGAQALIIESIVPLLESEANSLLGRMTDNRMSLKLETQRDTKTGGLKETLGIQISDELGTRDYEMYSGGEAFRIDLAIRIALSRLLAQRAGARLPTLFLDEGFGTQDAAGREKIADTINSISSEFKLILVITHLEELKEMFPVRIEVVKSSEGSVVTVS
ncbi:MAG: SMC family ATPase [Dehalococcoidia bacterium]|nr:SMC family ATPase [Dehalococcoidia bacterium]